MILENAWHHDQLAHDLACHLRGFGDVVVWEDMQLGPSGSARPDLYVIPKSYSAFKPRVYEIKVSRSDFLSDVTSGKWQKYLEFASCVIFAVPKGLVNIGEVPSGCGLICRGESWRQAKRATVQSVSTLPRNAWLKLLFDGIERQAARHALPRSASLFVAAQKIRSKVGEQVANAINNLGKVEGLIVYAEQQAEAARKRAREDTERETKRLRSIYAEVRGESIRVRRALGLPESCDWRHVENEINKLQADPRFGLKETKLRLQGLIEHIDKKLDAPAFQEDVYFDPARIGTTVAAQTKEQ